MGQLRTALWDLVLRQAPARMQAAPAQAVQHHGRIAANAAAPDAGDRALPEAAHGAQPPACSAAAAVLSGAKDACPFPHPTPHVPALETAPAGREPCDATAAAGERSAGGARAARAGGGGAGLRQGPGAGSGGCRADAGTGAGCQTAEFACQLLGALDDAVDALGMACCGCSNQGACASKGWRALPTVTLMTCGRRCAGAQAPALPATGGQRCARGARLGHGAAAHSWPTCGRRDAEAPWRRDPGFHAAVVNRRHARDRARSSAAACDAGGACCGAPPRPGVSPNVYPPFESGGMRRTLSPVASSSIRPLFSLEQWPSSRKPL